MNDNTLFCLNMAGGIMLAVIIIFAMIFVASGFVLKAHIFYFVVFLAGLISFILFKIDSALYEIKIEEGFKKVKEKHKIGGDKNEQR